jgi:hypothetical protein
MQLDGDGAFLSQHRLDIFELTCDKSGPSVAKFLPLPPQSYSAGEIFQTI